MIRVLQADDHELLRSGVAGITATAAVLEIDGPN